MIEIEKSIIITLLFSSAPSLFHVLLSAEGAEGEDSGTRFESIAYDPRLGLAVEGMQEGVTLESLWRVI